MSEVTKDIDYLAVSARIRAMENSLLSRERIERLLEAHGIDEMNKILAECGYPKIDPSRPNEMDEAISDARLSVFKDLKLSVPDLKVIDIFRIKYDYHNVKVILKANAMGADPDGMLMDMGRIPAPELKEALKNADLCLLPETLALAAAEAKETLDRTGDPRLSDILLDRRLYMDMQDVAEQTGSDFIKAYVRIQTDAANLRALIRTLRMGKNDAFLSGVLSDGGEIARDAVLKLGADRGRGIAELYAVTPFKTAAQEGEKALSGGPLTDFERLCDDAISGSLSNALLTAFGEAPLIGYLAAKETEYVNLRILLMGRAAGLAPAVIRKRLRACYV